MRPVVCHRRQDRNSGTRRMDYQGRLCGCHWRGTWSFAWRPRCSGIRRCSSSHRPHTSLFGAFVCGTVDSRQVQTACKDGHWCYRGEWRSICLGIYRMFKTRRLESSQGTFSKPLGRCNPSRQAWRRSYSELDGDSFRGIEKAQTKQTLPDLGKVLFQEETADQDSASVLEGCPRRRPQSQKNRYGRELWPVWLPAITAIVT